MITSDRAGSIQIFLTSASGGIILFTASCTESSDARILLSGLTTILLFIALAIRTVRFSPVPVNFFGSFVVIDIEPASKSTSKSIPSGIIDEIFFLISGNVNLIKSLMHPRKPNDGKKPRN